MMSDIKKIKFKVFRFNKKTDYLPYYDTFVLDVHKDDLVLDILNKIKWEHDGSFTYRRSCRHGICGSCAIKINGKATLACKDKVFDSIEIFGEELTIEPQDKGRAYKDLVIDKSNFWEKNNQVQPYLVAKIDEFPESENIVTIEETEKMEDADYCIACGACFYSCPAVEVNDKFVGPSSLVKAWRFNADSRDTAVYSRLEELQKLGSGMWDCVKCNECAEACPKELNPIDKITKLHLQTFQEGKALDNIAVRHAVGFKWSIMKHGILDEGELVKYSEGIPQVAKHIPEAIAMYKRGKIVMPWNMPKSKNLNEIQKLVDICSTSKFKGK
jgi:succinate dehydrogenase / fumarate reductase iron-sulfur subunit